MCLWAARVRVSILMGPNPSKDTITFSFSSRLIDGPETTDILIYGETSTFLHPPPLQLSPPATSTSAGPPPLSVRVAQITSAPRAPRPDDPTPRQPPANLLGNTTFGDLGANKRIVARPAMGQDRSKVKERGKEKNKMEDQVVRRAREVMLHLPRSKVPANGSSKAQDKRVQGDVHQQSQKYAVFKVPELPANARRKQGDGGTDVFGAVEPAQSRFVKGKITVTDREDGEADNTIEGANKLVGIFYLAYFSFPCIQTHV